MKTSLVVVGIVTFTMSPALAKEFWVAKDPETKKCEIVKEKPDGQTKLMIGTSSYATKEEAKETRGKTTC